MLYSMYSKGRGFTLNGLAILLCAAIPAQAAVYKCKQGSQTVYSDKPCHKAEIVDTTNAKPPTVDDARRANARSQLDKLTIMKTEAQAQLEKARQDKCNQMARDDNWTQSRAAEYNTDKWWRNKADDSAERLGRECSGYLIPQGAR